MDAQDFTDVIQVCTDGSSLSEKGVTTAVELAKTLGLPLLGMTVVKGDAPENGLEGEPQEVRDRLQTIVEEAEAAGIRYQVIAEHPEQKQRSKRKNESPASGKPGNPVGSPLPDGRGGVKAALQIDGNLLLQHHMENIFLTEIFRHVIHQHPHKIHFLIRRERLLRSSCLRPLFSVFFTTFSRILFSWHTAVPPRLIYNVRLLTTRHQNTVCTF